jgi:hypothetical protein
MEFAGRCQPLRHDQDSRCFSAQLTAKIRSKNNSCHALAGWYLARPYRKGWAKCRTAGRKGTNGLKSPAPKSAGGHNNTKINPVFRGMVRP